MINQNEGRNVLSEIPNQNFDFLRFHFNFNPFHLVAG